MSRRFLHFLVHLCSAFFILAQTANSQILPPQLTADYNADGVVNTGDYSVWRAEFGAFGGFLFADGNGDGLVDNLDYFEWKSQFGLTLDSVRVGVGGPTVLIDFVRDGNSRPLLDSNGNWQFAFSILPDSTLFGDLGGTPDKGIGSSIALDLGLQINDEHGFSNTSVKELSAEASGQSFENDPNWDGNALDPLGIDNPGVSPYGGLIDGRGLDASGHQIDAALGTIFFNSDNGGQGHRLFSFSAGRPAIDSNFGGLTIEVDIDGGYSGHYRLAQDFGTFDHPDADDFFAFTVQIGDVNLDGVVDPNDLAILDASLGNPGNWSDGDLTGEGLVDSADRSILLGILVPEPQSGCLLLGTVVLACLLFHRNQ